MAQDIKTAFFDIDGTLTSFVTHVVPQSTVDALHALQRNGVKVFICSGRAPSYMGVVLDTIPVTFDGIVGLNGQYCTTRDGLDYRHPIDQADVKLITDWLETQGRITVVALCAARFSSAANGAKSVSCSSTRATLTERNSLGLRRS